MHVCLLHTWSKLELARARRGLNTIWKMSIHRRQKIRKIYKKLAKVGTGMKLIQKTRFLPILAWFWSLQASPKAPKIDKKATRKNSKRIQSKKTQKKQKKRSELMGTAEIAGRGEEIGGEKKTSKTAKNNAKKMKTEIEAKSWRDGKAWRGRQDVEETEPWGWSSTPHRGAAERSAHSAVPTLEIWLLRWLEGQEWVRKGHYCD